MQQIMANRFIDRTLSKLESKAESAIVQSVLETFQVALGEIEPNSNPVSSLYQEVQKEFWLQLLQMVGQLRTFQWKSGLAFEPLLTQIDAMTEPEFMEFLSRIFHLLDYTVEVVSHHEDWGSHLVISKQGIQTVVHAQHGQTAVGMPAIATVMEARKHYHVHQALVVTNQTFMLQARQLAECYRVRLWERWDLKRILKQVHLFQI